MKKSFTIIALTGITLIFLLAGLAVAADPVAPSLTFEGEKYHFAWKDVSKEGNITNEYLKKGETLEEWTTMIGVRNWPAAGELSDVVAPYVESMQQYYVTNAEIYTPQDAKDDIIIEMFLGAPNVPYVEYNLHRFVIEKGTPGVKAYQFAQRIPLTEDLDLSETRTHLETRLNQLKTFKVTLLR